MSWNPLSFKLSAFSSLASLSAFLAFILSRLTEERLIVDLAVEFGSVI